MSKKISNPPPPDQSMKPAPPPAPPKVLYPNLVIVGYQPDSFLTTTPPGNEDTPEEEHSMFNCMDFCNGQIRVKAGRYGGGWLALGTATTEFDHDEKWDDLTGGDNDYFDARDYFNASEYFVLIEGASSARDAYDSCIKQLTEKYVADL